MAGMSNCFEIITGCPASWKTGNVREFRRKGKKSGNFFRKTFLNGVCTVSEMLKSTELRGASPPRSPLGRHPGPAGHCTSYAMA